jgi:hypothetical protein
LPVDEDAALAAAIADDADAGVLIAAIELEEKRGQAELAPLS